MQLLRSLGSPPIQSPPIALAIGNFDGVHLGHQAILKATVAAARVSSLQPAVMSFHPMPREYFARARAGVAAPARLMSAGEKLAAFQQAGLGRVYLPRFGRAFASQSPQAFIDTLVAINVAWLMVGADFRFGAQRTGDVELLRAAGAVKGFVVSTQDDVEVDGARVSSTAIRDALREARLNDAAKMLGRRYAITGRVTHGKKLGRTLGFPTANVALSGRKPALGGVFAVQCRLVTRGLEGVAGKDGVILNGVANLGTNPVVSFDNCQHLEVFLFDFSGDLYGKRLEVTFIEKIRDELNFAGLDGLVTQMHDDCARAKNVLKRIDDE
jgi:riboflavin kinase/FMN adenylyltransferase